MISLCIHGTETWSASELELSISLSQSLTLSGRVRFCTESLADIAQFSLPLSKPSTKLEAVVLLASRSVGVERWVETPIVLSSEALDDEGMIVRSTLRMTPYSSTHLRLQALERAVMIEWAMHSPVTRAVPRIRHSLMSAGRAHDLA